MEATSCIGITFISEIVSGENGWKFGEHWLEIGSMHSLNLFFPWSSVQPLLEIAALGRAKPC